WWIIIFNKLHSGFNLIWGTDILCIDFPDKPFFQAITLSHILIGAFTGKENTVFFGNVINLVLILLIDIFYFMDIFISILIIFILVIGIDFDQTITDRKSTRLNS